MCIVSPQYFNTLVVASLMAIYMPFYLYNYSSTNVYQLLESCNCMHIILRIYTLRLNKSIWCAENTQFTGAQLAQWLEHQTFNLRVMGSNPILGVLMVYFYAIK